MNRLLRYLAEVTTSIVYWGLFPSILHERQHVNTSSTSTGGSSGCPYSTHWDEYRGGGNGPPFPYKGRLHVARVPSSVLITPPFRLHPPMTRTLSSWRGHLRDRDYYYCCPGSDSFYLNVSDVIEQRGATPTTFAGMPSKRAFLLDPTTEVTRPNKALASVIFRIRLLKGNPSRSFIRRIRLQRRTILSQREGRDVHFYFPPATVAGECLSISGVAGGVTSRLNKADLATINAQRRVIIISTFVFSTVIHFNSNTVLINKTKWFMTRRSSITHGLCSAITVLKVL